MAFITRCSKKLALSNWRCWLLVVAMVLAQGLVRPAWATEAPDVSRTPVLKLERTDDALWLTAQFRFELPVVVEDALLKGIPIYFVAQAELLRERWYWTNRKVASVQRRMRLAYHPLTQRWRLNIGSGDMTEATQGLTLNLNFDTLTDAMAAVRRFSRWKIAEAADLEPGAQHIVEFRFALDTSQLPRPLQIGTLGQSDWQIALTASQVLGVERGK
ncbi:DUF4390 domain-containing protein [Rhodoferax sp.]|uniref:DUF4390 domain-containing protein n=1 Tax=Rhodoferax sp. TaxID=50421 RepID=UPI0026100E67|nr:DUF4390 domain-containing protein [Rhodoferax sp.]MDD2925653.1 DUF4390 domain-containing protein [Rhodoferax sp.]